VRNGAKAEGRVDRLAVIVPLKDEEEGVPALAAALRALRDAMAGDAALEYVLVDDGSVDGTWLALQREFGELAGVRLERHEHNRGLAAAIRTGIRATDAALCASLDADLSYDPGELRAMLPLLDGADVVTASPYHPDGGVQGVPGWRLFLSRSLSRCYRWLLRSDVRTWTSCFRVYRRATVVDLPLVHPGFLGTAELLVRVLRRGGSVREHPCVLGVRRAGASKMRVLRTILGHLGLLLQVTFRRVA
jgi:dolichol-phosphate mannosyltransferase